MQSQNKIHKATAGVCNPFTGIFHVPHPLPGQFFAFPWKASSPRKCQAVVCRPQTQSHSQSTLPQRRQVLPVSCIQTAKLLPPRLVNFPRDTCWIFRLAPPNRSSLAAFWPCQVNQPAMVSLHLFFVAFQRSYFFFSSVGCGYKSKKFHARRENFSFSTSDWASVNKV